MQLRHGVVAAVVLSLSAPAFAQPAQSFNTTLAYDPVYDNGNLSTTGITCSNGAKGVICRDCALTLFQIPYWPNLAGAPVVAGWNSGNCSSCWALALPAYNTTIHVRAVDSSSPSGGFNVGFAVMDAATNGRALAAGRVDALATRALDDACEQGQGQGQPDKQAAQPFPPPQFGCP